jgi:hypothetical protein
MRDKLHELEEMATQMFSDRPQPSEPELSQRTSVDREIAQQDCQPAGSGLGTVLPTADAEETNEAAALGQRASPLAGLELKRVIHLRWALRDIKGKRTKLSPLNPDDLRALVEMGFVEVRDGVALLTNEGERALD